MNTLTGSQKRTRGRGGERKSSGTDLADLKTDLIASFEGEREKEKIKSIKKKIIINKVC